MRAERRPFPWALVRHWAAVYLPAWLLMAAVIFLVQTVLAAVLHEREDMINMLETLDRMPKIFKSFIGGDELMPSNMNAIVAIGYQHPTILTMLMINAILVPTGLLTGQAERGTLDLLLARPITRSRVYGIAVMLSLASQTFLVWIVFLGTAIGTRYFDYGERIPLGGFVRVTINLTALSWAAGGVCTLAAAWFNERSRAIAAATSYFVASYLLDFAVVWLPRLDSIHPLTLYNYCRPNDILKAGVFPWTDVAVLVGIALATLGVGWHRWRRRDLFAS